MVVAGVVVMVFVDGCAGAAGAGAGGTSSAHVMLLSIKMRIPSKCGVPNIKRSKYGQGCWMDVKLTVTVVMIVYITTELPLIILMPS